MGKDTRIMSVLDMVYNRNKMLFVSTFLSNVDNFLFVNNSFFFLVEVDAKNNYPLCLNLLVNATLIQLINRGSAVL